MEQYGLWLKSRGIKQSFSMKGNCMDNSLMENFFRLLKNEMYYGHEYKFKTIDDLKKDIEEYIKWYNEERINVKRKGLSHFYIDNNPYHNYNIKLSCPNYLIPNTNNYAFFISILDLGYILKRHLEIIA